jgi:hypothetical protein
VGVLAVGIAGLRKRRSASDERKVLLGACVVLGLFVAYWSLFAAVGFLAIVLGYVAWRNRTARPRQ